MRNHKSVLFLLTAAIGVAACGGGQKAAAPPPVAVAEERPLEPERAQTPSERLGPEAPAGPRVIAALDQAIGPKFSNDGDRFTATVRGLAVAGRHQDRRP